MKTKSLSIGARARRFVLELPLDRPEQSLTHRITLRYREGVTGAMRLTSGLRRFAIRAAADPDGSKRDLVCLVEEMRA